MKSYSRKHYNMYYFLDLYIKIYFFPLNFKLIDVRGNTNIKERNDTVIINQGYKAVQLGI